MSAKGEMLYAWSKDADIQKKGECGGAVTTLLKYALESKMVDAVLAVRKGADIYDAKPEIVTNPADLVNTAGSLHCGTLLLSKLFVKYLDGAKNMKIAATVKGCDAMGIYELAKRKKINLDNVILIGVNCGGSVSAVTARKMIKEKFGVDPDKVHKEEIDKGQFIIEYEGGHKGISMDELEEQGFGRRANCRRCKMKVPRQTDIACGNWGVLGDKAGNATFVEICSEKGAKLLDGAVKSGALAVEPANPKGVEIRGKVEGAMLKLGDKWRAKDFEALGGTGMTAIAKMMQETSRCIKCYSCVEACPVNFDMDGGQYRYADLVKSGQLPPNFTYHLIRLGHVADSCVNCGQCQELCPMDIPNSLFSHAYQVELEKAYKYTPGVDMKMPVVARLDDAKGFHV